jgi:hypothetical protein
MLASVHCLVRFLAFGKPKEVTEDADGKGRAQYSSVPGGTTEPSGETSQNGRWLPGPPVHSGGWTPADFNCTRKEMKAREGQLYQLFPAHVVASQPQCPATSPADDLPMNALILLSSELTILP